MIAISRMYPAIRQVLGVRAMVKTLQGRASAHPNRVEPTNLYADLQRTFKEHCPTEKVGHIPSSYVTEISKEFFKVVGEVDFAPSIRKLLHKVRGKIGRLSRRPNRRRRPHLFW